MKKFKCVLVYTGYGEMSITKVWGIEGASKEQVKPVFREMKGGDEDCVVVVEEGEEVYNIVEKDQNEWDDNEWDAWERFIAKTFY